LIIEKKYNEAAAHIKNRIKLLNNQGRFQEAAELQQYLNTLPAGRPAIAN
jgi:hypothetical protein